MVELKRRDGLLNDTILEIGNWSIEKILVMWNETPCIIRRKTKEILEKSKSVCYNMRKFGTEVGIFKTQLRRDF